MLITANSKEVILLKLALKESARFFHQFNVGDSIIVKVDLNGTDKSLPKDWNKNLGNYLYD